MNAVLKQPSWLPPESEFTAVNIPHWLTEYKQQQWQIFLKHGLPTRQNERWKYHDLSFIAQQNFTPAHQVNTQDIEDAIHQHRLRRGESILLVFINGYFAPGLSDLAKLPNEVIACNAKQALQLQENLYKIMRTTPIDEQKYPFACLNAAMSHDGLFFYLPDQCELAAPLHVLSLVVSDKNFISHPHQIFVLGDNSKLSLVQEHFALAEQTYLTNITTSVLVGQHAHFDYCKIQNEGSHAIHLANTFINQQKDSTVKITHFTNGAKFARDDIEVKLQGPGAQCSTAGFYRLHNDEQTVDYHIDIIHDAPRTQSEMLYKGILDQKSKAVFNGRLVVEKDAQKILAYQANHNLLLSNNAEVYSKPELEIYADDVKCKHGATIGQIDEEALFYLRSRGIDKKEALNMLLEGFAEEITARISHLGIQLRVQELLACL